MQASSTSSSEFDMHPGWLESNIVWLWDEDFFGVNTYEVARKVTGFREIIRVALLTNETVVQLGE